MNGHSRGADVQDVPLWPTCAGLSNGVMPPKMKMESRAGIAPAFAVLQTAA